MTMKRKGQDLASRYLWATKRRKSKFNMLQKNWDGMKHLGLTPKNSLFPCYSKLMCVIYIFFTIFNQLPSQQGSLKYMSLDRLKKNPLVIIKHYLRFFKVIRNTAIMSTLNS